MTDVDLNQESNLREVLLRGLMAEYGDDEEAWTDMRSLTRIAAALEANFAARTALTGEEVAQAEAERTAPSACHSCGHRAIWHHDERGCQYHGNGPSRCPCRRDSDQVVARAIHEAMIAAALPWLNRSVDAPRFRPDTVLQEVTLL